MLGNGNPEDFSDFSHRLNPRSLQLLTQNLRLVIVFFLPEIQGLLNQGAKDNSIYLTVLRQFDGFDQSLGGHPPGFGMRVPEG
ncbi:hypothetical protein ES703_39768 [subsurface metagenome]